MSDEISTYWLSGNYYDVTHKWKSIVASRGDVNIQSLGCGGEDASAGNVIMMLKMRDMFDKRPRIIKLNGLPEDYTILADYLNFCNKNNVLVVISPAGKQSASKFYKAIDKVGGAFDFGMESKTDGEAIRWASKCVTGYGRKITDGAAKLLVEYKGRNFDALHSEISKLIDYQPKGDLSEQSVKECCLPSFQASVWDLVDSLDQQQFELSMERLEKVLLHAGATTGSTFGGDIEALFGVLYHHFLFVIMISSAQSFNYSDLVNSVKGLKKRKKNDDGSYSWDKDAYEANFVSFMVRKDGIRKVFQWPRRHIYAVLLDLLRCRYSVRRSYFSESSIKLCLESFVSLVCNKIDLRQARSMKLYGEEKLWPRK